MKNLLLLCSLLLTLAARAAEAPAAAPESPLAQLASLVGGLWVAELPVPADGIQQKIVVRFAWTENQRAIRFDSAFVTNTERKPYTSGFYAWDGAKGKLAIFYVDNLGDLTEGVITPEGGTLVNELTVTEPTGKAHPVRVRLTKVGADVFTNEIFLMKDRAWEPYVSVRYERRK